MLLLSLLLFLLFLFLLFDAFKYFLASFSLSLVSFLSCLRYPLVQELSYSMWSYLSHHLVASVPVSAEICA